MSSRSAEPRRFVHGLACAAAFVVVLGLGGARAENGAAADKTQALMELIGGGATVEQLVNLVYQQSVAALLQANPEAGAAVQGFVDAQVLPQIRAAVPAMMAAAAGSFAQRFSEQEIEQIVAFYRSPVGQKLRRVRPALLRETLQMGQLWAAETFRETLARLKPQLEAQGLKAPDI